jgi:hypothetical protein
MGCGLGGCYSCVVAVKPTFARASAFAKATADKAVGKHGDDLSSDARSAKEEHANLVRSCISGPVFDGAELVWE